MSFIKIERLGKTYSSDADTVIALGQIDLEIVDGAFLGVMGPSGSGKSTFLSILGALCHPSNGRIEVDGIDLYALSSEKRADFRREYLGFVFQSFNLIPYLTAQENVMLPLAVKKIPVKQKKMMANQVLAREDNTTHNIAIFHKKSNKENTPRRTKYKMQRSRL